MIEKKNFLEKLKAKWGINSNFQVVIICLVFAITGSLSVKVGAPVLNLLHIDNESMSGWIYWPLRILVIFPIYQILLISIGTIFGQFRFFWNIEKKMFGRLIGKPTR